ncbi:MAG: hypothetical protein ACXW2U_20455 [Telluria sp.]
MPANRSQVALTRAAYVAARLVIGRWQDGSRLAHLNLSLPHNESIRARWFARTRQGLEEWIASGGFSADDVRSQPVSARQPSRAHCATPSGSCANAAGQCERACVD